MSLVLLGSTSGSVTVDVPSVAGTNTLTLPAQTATVATLTTPSFASTIGVGGATAAASGAGISFPATQSASTNSNTLDDYEEGSFTPTIEGQSGAGTYVYDTTNTFGRYQKVGNRVNFDLCVGISSVTSAGSGNLYVAGLPFTPLGFTNYYASCSVGYFVFVTTGWNGYYISCLTITGTSKLAIYYSGTSSSAAMPISVMAGVSYLYISGSYLT